MKRRNLLIASLAILSMMYTSVQAQNLLEANQSFSEGLRDWENGVWGDEQGEPKGYFKHYTEDGQDDSSSIRVICKKPTKDGQGNKLFLKRSGLKLRRNRTYILTFWLKSRYADDEMYMTIFSGPDTGSKKAWGGITDQTFKFTGDGQWHKMTHRFTAKSQYPDHPADLKNAAIVFGFDKRKGTYFIDNISLREE